MLLVMAACDRAGHADTRALTAITADTLCVTSGELTSSRVDAPTFRAVALGHAGDAASLRFRIRGTTTEERALDSGALRHQLGLKLRAQDACNLVYVMWRLAPTPRVEVSVKRNPGLATSKECGARGYKNVKPRVRHAPPAVELNTTHELHAEIAGDALTAWIDGNIVWQGILPETARTLTGPAGIRSDNVEVDIVDFRVDERSAEDATARCAKSERSAD